MKLNYLIGLLLFVLSPAADACICRMGTASELVNDADVIFSAITLETRTVRYSDRGSARGEPGRGTTSSVGFGPMITAMKITEIYKNNSSSRADLFAIGDIIYLIQEASDCMLGPLVEYNEYLIVGDRFLRHYVNTNECRGSGQMDSLSELSNEIIGIASSENE